MLPRFAALYPAVTIDVQVTDRAVDLVGEGYDLAIRIGALADSPLVARKLAPIQIVMCASPDYLRRCGTPAVPEDLRDHCCLMRRTHGTTIWQFQRAGRTVNPPITGRLSATDGEVLREAAIAGLGLAWLPDFIVSAAIRDGRLVSVMEDFVPTDRAFYAVTPQHRHLPAAVRALIDFSLAEFAPRPSWALD